MTRRLICSPGRDGFTLIEALLSIVLLALIASGVASLFASGLDAADSQAQRMLLDSALRSRMEAFLGLNYSQLRSLSLLISVDGQTYTMDVAVTSIDLDSDTIVESDAVQLTLSIVEEPACSLTTIIVDDGGAVRKI